MLEAGLAALKNMAPSSDFPEAIIACDSIVLGSAIRIPGVNAVGFAAESDADVPGLAIDVPCVIGVRELLSSVSEGDILIVDGYRGLVHIDPDPATLIHYQQAEEHHRLREKVFIASEHIPARTASGDVVYVYATLTTEAELDVALDAGADGLVFDLRTRYDDTSAVCGDILREAAGKPVVLIVDMHCEDILRAAMVYCMPGQLTLVSEHADFLEMQVEKALDHVVLEALQLDIDPPQVALGGFAHVSERPTDGEFSLLVDARDQAVTDLLPVLDGSPIVMLGEPGHISAAVASAGAKRIAIAPDKVAEAKLIVRSIGLEEEV